MQKVTKSGAEIYRALDIPLSPLGLQKTYSTEM
jgi:hypothetical protein